MGEQFELKWPVPGALGRPLSPELGQLMSSTHCNTCQGNGEEVGLVVRYGTAIQADPGTDRLLSDQGRERRLIRWQEKKRRESVKKAL